MAKRQQRKPAAQPASLIDPLRDPVGAALQVLGDDTSTTIGGPPILPSYDDKPSKARTLAELFAEPIRGVWSQANSDCGVRAVCAAGGLSYAEFLTLDPRTPAQIRARARKGHGLYAKEMVTVLEAVWPGSKWYVQPVGGKPTVSSYKFKPPRGVVLTPGHWVAFQVLDGRATIRDDGLIPAENYTGTTVSKIVAPSPTVTGDAAAQIRRAEIATEKK